MKYYTKILIQSIIFSILFVTVVVLIGNKYLHGSYLGPETEISQDAN